MDGRKGIWTSIGAKLAAVGFFGHAAVVSCVGVVAGGCLWLADAPGPALGWTFTAVTSLAVGLAVAGGLGPRPRPRGGKPSRAPKSAQVLASKALPKDIKLFPISVAQGPFESPAGRPQGAADTPQRTETAEVAPPPPAPDVVARAAGGLEDLPGVEAVEIEIGYALVPLASDSRGGEWLGRIGGLRREIAAELGMLLPPVKIRDNIKLGAHEYVIKIHGVKVGSGKLLPSQLLALATDASEGKPTGQQALAPGLGTPAVWIYPSQRRKAERMNYKVIDPPGVLMTHLSIVVRRHAADLLSREHTSWLLENLRADHEELVRGLAKKLKVADIQKLLQSLLREAVSIGNLRAVLESLADAAEQTTRFEDLTELTREFMGPIIARQHADEDGRLWCVCLDPGMESMIARHLTHTAAGSVLTIPQGLRRQMMDAIATALARLRARGRRGVVLCARDVRPAVRQLIAPVESGAAVLGHNEVKTVAVHAVATVAVETAKPKTYRAPTVAAALAEAKRDLGRDATIVRTRKSRGGLRQLLGARRGWEVTAVANANAAYCGPGEGSWPVAPADAQAPQDASPPEAPKKRPHVESSDQAEKAVEAPGHVVKQMTEIHRMVEALVARNGGPAETLAPQLREFHGMLIAQEVAPKIAAALIEQLQKSLTPDQLHDRDFVARKLRQEIAGRIRTVGADVGAGGGQRRVIALIGPTGVGKTTTIAKLAANFKLSAGKRVGLVTIDTYRIAAVEQLRTYANIIEVPLRVVLTPKDLPEAIDSLAGSDVVLIDTAGRSQKDKARLHQLRKFLAEAPVGEIHLVISATSNCACTKQTIENFAPLGANRVILSKLDEAETFGTILNVACALDAPLSYVTTGQDVPDDISQADAEQLAGRIMGGLICVG